jgi:hypothetical protein
MSEQISLEFSDRDVRAVTDNIARAMRSFNKSAGEALRWAAWNVARSLGTSTKVAPKHRPIVEKGARILDRAKRYEVTSEKKGRTRKFTIYAANKNEAKKHPFAVIGNRGLAKASWMWGVSKLGRGATWGSVRSSARKRAKNNSQVEQKLSGTDMYVKIVNSLPYAQDALNGGPNDVNTAMARGMRAMTKAMDAKLVKEMGLGKLSR